MIARQRFGVNSPPEVYAGADPLRLDVLLGDDYQLLKLLY
jgi:hypothetical protein